jgi:hypothetical protein
MILVLIPMVFGDTVDFSLQFWLNYFGPIGCLMFSVSHLGTQGMKIPVLVLKISLGIMALLSIVGNTIFIGHVVTLNDWQSSSIGQITSIIGVFLLLCLRLCCFGNLKL